MKKKLIKITQADVNDIVVGVLRTLEEGKNPPFRIFDGMRIKFIGRDEILPLSDYIWEMLNESYSNIGGLKTYVSKSDFIRKVKYAKIATLNNEIVACSIYRKIEDSYKMVAIGCNQTEEGKSGLQMLIFDDIVNFDLHFWAEVSGAIEHYFKKYNGYPMPNTLAEKILNNKNIKLSDSDEVHYKREIGGDWYTKAIYGVKSDEIFKEAINAVENYSKFMEKCNKIQESSVDGLRYSLDDAVYIIENIYRAHEEDGYNELIPSWYQALNDCMETLKHSKMAEDAKDYIEDYIEYCEYLLDVMPLLELHTLDVEGLRKEINGNLT